jgi:hypothetical protein
MKISRTFLVLIFTALMLFAGAYYSGRLAQQIRNDEEIKRIEKSKKQSEVTGQVQFWISDTGEDDRNYADYIATSLFILALSTILAAVWIKKSDTETFLNQAE